MLIIVSKTNYMQVCNINLIYLYNNTQKLIVLIKAFIEFLFLTHVNMG